MGQDPKANQKWEGLDPSPTEQMELHPKLVFGFQTLVNWPTYIDNSGLYKTPLGCLIKRITLVNVGSRFLFIEPS